MSNKIFLELNNHELHKNGQKDWNHVNNENGHGNILGSPLSWNCIIVKRVLEIR